MTTTVLTELAFEVDDDVDEDCLHEAEDGWREPAPLFGCACENPLTVDTVCDYCIEYLKEQAP